MLSPYNILYPHLASMVDEDDYIRAAKGSLDYIETIIHANYSLNKNKKVNIVAFVVDIDNDNFMIQNIHGKNISNELTEVFVGTVWLAKNFLETIPKTDNSYTPGKVIVRMPTDGDNIGRNIFHSKECDQYVMAQPPMKRFEYLLNAASGVTISGKESETVIHIDASLLTIETSSNTYHLKHSDILVTLQNGDTIERFTMLDKIMSTNSTDGYIKVTIKPEFEHFSDMAKSDINVITEIGSI